MYRDEFFPSPDLVAWDKQQWHHCVAKCNTDAVWDKSRSRSRSLSRSRFILWISVNSVSLCYILCIGWSDVTAVCGDITISMLWGNTACCVKLSGEDLSSYSNKIECK